MTNTTPIDMVVSFLEKKDGINCYIYTSIIPLDIPLDKDNEGVFKKLEKIVNNLRYVIQNENDESVEPNLIDSDSSKSSDLNVDQSTNEEISQVKSSDNKDNESSKNKDQAAGKSKHRKSYSHSRKHKKNKNKKMRITSKIIP
jgi:hypothetical protein